MKAPWLALVRLGRMLKVSLPWNWVIKSWGKYFPGSFVFLCLQSRGKEKNLSWSFPPVGFDEAKISSPGKMRKYMSFPWLNTTHLYLSWDLRTGMSFPVFIYTASSTSPTNNSYSKCGKKKDKKTIINSKLIIGLVGRINSNKYLSCLIHTGYCSRCWGYRVNKTDENNIWYSGSLYFWFISAQYFWKKKLIQW